MVDSKKYTDEQYQAVCHEQGDVMISASAGSGKTRVMIDRLVRLVTEKKAQVKNVLAVTFTEVAANEMKTRLKQDVSKIVAVTKDKDLIRQLADIDTSDICTLHSFCARLIRTYFFVIGVAPDFTVADDVVAGDLKGNAINEVFDALYEKDDLQGIGFSKLVTRHGVRRNDKNLKEIVVELFEYASEESDPQEWLDKSLYRYTEQGFNEMLRDYKERVDRELECLVEGVYDAVQPLRDAGYGEVGGKASLALNLANHIKEFLDADSIMKLKEFDYYNDSFSNYTRSKKVVSEQVHFVKNAYDIFIKILGEFREGFGEFKEDDLQDLYNHTLALISLVKRFADRYAKLKKDENVLDFADLQHFALEILRDETVNDAVRKKYSYVFVDEYQDINGVQNEIIERVSSNNAFMVGDLKQSIYAFRGCRADFFQNRFEEMKRANKKTIQLNHNFRSADAVIEMVNDVFDYCMTPKCGGVDYKKDARLVSGGLYKDDNGEYKGRAELHFIDKKKETKEEKEAKKAIQKEEKVLPIYNILDNLELAEEEEISKTANIVQGIIDKEILSEYYDLNEKRMKRVTYGDIVILTRGRDGAFESKLVAGLARRNIPVVSECSMTTIDRQEIKMMLAILQTIDCLAQDIPLATTLKSPLANISDDELFLIWAFYKENQPELAKRGTFVDAYKYYLENGEDLLKIRLQKFDKYIRDLRFLADFQGACDVLNKIIKDNHIESYLLAQAGGNEKLKCVHKLLSSTQVSGKKLSIKEFLKRVEINPKSINVPCDGGEDAVRVMTMHSSKGAQFPVVIACGLERKMNSKDENEEILYSRQEGFAVKWYDDLEKRFGETPLRVFIRDDLKKNRVMEEQRLFYVTLTRAKYSLHMVCASEKDERKSEFYTATRMEHFIPSDIPATKIELDKLSNNSVKSTTREVLVIDPDVTKLEKIKNDLAKVYPFTADTTLSIKSSVTALNKHKIDEVEPPILTLFEEEDNTTAKLGTTAHKILELFDFSRRGEFLVQLNEMLSSGQISESELQGLNVDKIANAINGTAFDCLENKRLFREKVFMVNVPANLLFDTTSETPVLVQGIIDLLAIDGENAYVIDYKYSALSSDRLKEKYQKQLNLYAYAVERGLGLKVKSKFIISLLTGETVEID